MKKRKLLLMLIALLCVIAGVLSACHFAENNIDSDTAEESETNRDVNSDRYDENASDTLADSENTAPPENSGIRIQMTFDGQTVYAMLYDNSVSLDLVSRLPLTLTFIDYNDTEKIAYLPEGAAAWDTSAAPDSCTPEAGDIAMYAPWGNLSVFYRSFQQSNGLVPLGKLENGGVEAFASMTGDVIITISLADDDMSAFEETNQTEIPEQSERSKILIAYFSCTGNTKAVAEQIATLTGGDLYEIIPAEPYSSADLNYNNSNCRANIEMNDPASRPAIGSDSIDISEYDTVILGYPIWWSTMPRIVNTFLDSYDLSGKTVLPFCTSGGSGISKSVSDIKAAEPGATVEEGLRVSGTNDNHLETWLRSSGAITE